MEIQNDFKELLELFNAHDVAYVVVGAHALAFHGAPRYTGGLDLLVHAHPANALRVIAALEAFGFGSLSLAPEDFALPDREIQLGVAPVRADLITSLTGVPWEEALAGSCVGEYGTVLVRFLGRRELLQNRRVLGCAKDLADIEALGEEPHR